MYGQHFASSGCHHPLKESLKLIPGPVIMSEALHVDSARLQPLLILVFTHTPLVELISDLCISSCLLHLSDCQQSEDQHERDMDPALVVSREVFVV